MMSNALRNAGQVCYVTVWIVHRQLRKKIGYTGELVGSVLGREMNTSAQAAGHIAVRHCVDLRCT